MGPAEELVRIAKKLDKMVARKSTVKEPSSSGHVHIFTHICICTCAYLHTCLFTCMFECCWVAWERGGGFAFHNPHVVSGGAEWV